VSLPAPKEFFRTNAVEKDKQNVSEFQADLLKVQIEQIFSFACLICYIASAI
jgi:hypothetical protein